MTSQLKAIAKQGEKIYRQRYKAEYEKLHLGMYGVVEIKSARIFIAETPEEAFQQGIRELPQGKFYLLKIGAAGVYRVAYSRSNPTRGNRLHQGL